MSKVSGTVVQVDSIERTVKGKPKRVYSFKLDDGNWYRTNFTPHNLEVGQAVTFPFTEDRWGKNVEPKDITVTGIGAPPAATSAPPPAVRRAATFPVGLLDGQRSIVRQTAVKAAAEIVAHNMIDVPLAEGEKVTVDVIADITLQLAAKFEAYACGDAEVAAAAAEDEGE